MMTSTEHTPSPDTDESALPPLSEADLPRSEEEIDAALVRLIAETEATVTRLQTELAERRAQQAQHEEIERLEHHLAEATVNWTKVREFFEEALRELTGSRAREENADPEAE